MALTTFPNDAGVAAPKPTRRGALDRPPAQRGGHPASCPYLGRPSLPPCSRGADRPRTGLGCGSGRCSVAVTIAERCGRPARHSLPTTKMAADASRAAPPRKMAARPHRPTRPPARGRAKQGGGALAARLEGAPLPEASVGGCVRGRERPAGPRRQRRPCPGRREQVRRERAGGRGGGSGGGRNGERRDRWRG